MPSNPSAPAPPSEPARRGPRRTLGARLLGLLLPGLALVLGGGLWQARAEAEHAADAAFDRALLGAIKGLDLSISTASGGLAVEQPYRLFEFFQLTAATTVHYRVATDDGLVEIGSPDLPAPPGPLRDGEPLFYDAVYFGEAVRVGALRRALDPPLGSARQVLIQVAEGTEARERFTRGFVRQALGRDALVLGVLALAVLGASAWALAPVRRLAEATRSRRPDDLRPLQSDGLPAELLPLVDAVNQQLARTAALTEQRRQFIDDASHQLRTPLATLRAQLDFARREPDASRQAEVLQALSQELDHATRGTAQLLALARADAAAHEPEPLDLAELAREVALALLPQARERGIDFGVEVPETGAPARGDHAPLREALTNLAHNALVHGAGPVTLEAGADAAEVWVGVSDAGPGLEPELRERVGQRFAKGRGSRGSGLGLSIASAVARRHGGRLEIGPADPDAADGSRGLRVRLCWPREMA
jgi:two-component system sensor histidine kinase TctE